MLLPLYAKSYSILYMYSMGSNPTYMSVCFDVDDV